MIRAVTLDAYGTVFDFESHLSDVAAEVLAAGGATGPSPRALAEAWSSHFTALYDEFGRRHHEDGREFRTIAELTTDALAAARARVASIDTQIAAKSAAQDAAVAATAAAAPAAAPHTTPPPTR